MDEDDDILDRLAKSIADGGSIQWDELETLPADDPRRRLIEHLRVVADVAELHRSAVDATAEDLSTAPVSEQTPYIGRVPPPLASDHRQDGLGRWGHLLLRRKIGSGGFGEVFHAHDMWLDHPVALKLLKPEVAKSDSTRILHEARRLARVRHPNVVAVHGADMHGGRIGFWMDLVEGDTLADLVARGRLSPLEAANIGQEICLALAAVHGANLVHRDVKAQNVMRASDTGRIILMDFGAGEFIDRLTVDGRMRGTPLYLAPEIFNNTGASVASDVYAVGVLLYHLVTGGFPVNASSIAGLAEAHKNGMRRRLTDVRPDLPESFVSVVERAIDPDPKRRFASAGEMYVALRGETPSDAGKTTIGHTIVRGVLVALAVMATTEALGLIATRAFESALHVDPMFAAGLADYFSVGFHALLPFVLVWTAAGAGFAVLAAFRPLIWARLGAFRQRWSRFTESLDPSMIAGALVAIGALGFLALTWQFYDLYDRITALALDPRPETLDLSVLGWSARQLHRTHAGGCAAVSFLMGLAAWRWFPHLEKRAAEPARVRHLQMAALVIATLLVAEETLTRPFIWDPREIVTFENRPASVIGSSSQELLLYRPEPGARTYLRVRVNDNRLQRNVASRALFDLGHE